jgi:hypothetical protein
MLVENRIDHFPPRENPGTMPQDVDNDTDVER